MKINNYIAIITLTIVFLLIKLTPLNSGKFSILNSIIIISIYIIGFLITLYMSYPLLKKDWFKFKRIKWIKYLFILISFLFMIVILKVSRLILFNILPTESSNGQNNTSQEALSLYVIILASLPSILAPFYEELAFRNNLFYQLKAHKYVALLMAIISSFLFGIIHYYNFNSITATIPYMCIGLYFCIIYYYKKNIFYIIIPHLLLNWFNVFLAIIGYLFIKYTSI